MKTLEFAHRGAIHNDLKEIIYVENTKEAILEGLRLSDGVEIDIMCVGEEKKIWWVCHDYDLGRLGSKQTLRTATTKTKLHDGNSFGYLLSLKDLLITLTNLGTDKKKFINIEIKPHNGLPTDNDLHEVVQMINQFTKNSNYHCFFSSFDQEIVNKMSLNARVGYLFDNVKDFNQLKSVNNNVFVITVQHNENTDAMLTTITKKFGQLGGIYFPTRESYFQNHKRYKDREDIKVMYCEPLIRNH